MNQREKKKLQELININNNIRSLDVSRAKTRGIANGVVAREERVRK